MVQIHLGPLNVSPGQGGFHPDEHSLEAPGMPSNSKKTQRRFPGPDVPWPLWTAPMLGRDDCPASQRARPLGLEQVPVEVVSRSDVRVPHAPHDLEGICAPVDHERVGTGNSGSSRAHCSSVRSSRLVTARVATRSPVFRFFLVDEPSTGDLTYFPITTRPSHRTSRQTPRYLMSRCDR